MSKYIIELVAPNDGSDDLILPLPDELMNELKWQEGDDLSFNLSEKNQIVVENLSLKKRKP